MIYSSVRMHQARPGTVSFVSFLPPFDTSICLFVRLSVCPSVCVCVHRHFMIAIMSYYTHHSSSDYSALHQITCALQLHYIIIVRSTVHFIFLKLHLIPVNCTLLNTFPSLWLHLKSLVFCVRKAFSGRLRFWCFATLCISSWPPVPATAQAHPAKWEGQAMLDGLGRLQFFLHQTLTNRHLQPKCSRRWNAWLCDHWRDLVPVAELERV